MFFASLIGTFSLFASFPLFFLLFNEIFKCCKKDKGSTKEKKKTKRKEKLNIIDKNVELETKSLILEDEEDDLNINNVDSLGINRDTLGDTNEIKTDSNDIFKQDTKNSIESIPQTPIIKEKNNSLFDSFSEE